MKHSDVFIKSDLGRKEVKYHTLGILPREARTLLIMVDGKRSYRSYLEALDKDKMFVEFGGVKPLFELLLELDCIEVIGQPSIQLADKPLPINKAYDTERDKPFHSQPSADNEPIDSDVPANTTTIPEASYDTVKSALASCIENNAPPEEAWGHLLSLEKCSEPTELLALVEQMQKSTNSALSNEMDRFYKKIAAYI